MVDGTTGVQDRKSFNPCAWLHHDTRVDLRGSIDFCVIGDPRKWMLKTKKCIAASEEFLDGLAKDRIGIRRADRANSNDKADLVRTIGIHELFIGEDGEFLPRYRRRIAIGGCENMHVASPQRCSDHPSVPAKADDYKLV